MTFVQSYYSDIGTTRKSNEDSLAIVKAETDVGEVVLTIVCDGMGGYAYGEVASKYCVEQIVTWFKKVFSQLLYQGINDAVVNWELRRVITRINRELAEAGNMTKVKLGCTLTTAIFCQGRCYIAHVGDSRAYRVGTELCQLTKDQTLIGKLVETGKMSKEQARLDKRKNKLLECMGITSNVEVFFYSEDIVKNNTYLLCSDGFWHELDQDDLCRYLNADSISDSEAMRMRLHFLVEQVKFRGERDNISAVAIFVR